jgi:hypothetical protein
MQRNIEGQLRGIEFCECYVSCGSYWILRTIEDQPFTVRRTERPLTGKTKHPDPAMSRRTARRLGGDLHTRAEEHHPLSPTIDDQHCDPHGNDSAAIRTAFFPARKD